MNDIRKFSRRNFIKNTALGSVLFTLPSCRVLNCFNSPSGLGSNATMPLNGNWHFRLDPENKGIEQEWSKDRFVNAVSLPGSMQSQGFGNNVTAETVWWGGKLKGVWQTSPVYEKYRQPGKVKIYEFLQPTKHYLGVAWYSKEFVLPKSWINKRIGIGV